VIAAQLEEAAVTARARGAPVAAAELFELSIERTPPGKAERRTVRQVSAAKSWFDAGDLGRAEAMLMQVTAGPLAASIRARALGLLAQLHSRRSSFALALAVGQEALEAATGDDALSADLEMDVGYFCVSLGDIPGSLEHAQRALVAAERTGARGVLADALGVTAVLQFMAGGGLDEDRVRRARELEDPTRERTWQMSPEFTYGCMLLYSGRLDEALLVLGRLHADSLDRGQESPIPYSCFWLAWAHVWRGDFAAARRCADESSKAAALLEDPAAHAFALTTSALVHAHDGSTDDARREALEAVHRLQELGWLVGSVYALWALGIAELSSGNPAAVDAALGPLSAQVTALPAGDPLFGLFLPEEVEALVELGELDRADSLLQWLEQRASALDRAWARAAAGRCRGLLWTARGDSDRGVVVLEDALAQHARSDMPFERARTLLVKGQVHRRRKEKRLATAALREAQQTFARLGARQWALKATAELSRLGLRPSKADELTPTERRIAELAVAGLANSEIAERAFLTTKTVEANLTRVYHKLGIRSRGGLARALQSAVESTHE
jgi:DNA-binding CsgD family transcriptional regulator/tetratricopeptide (TPR) repeat protein